MSDLLKNINTLLDDVIASESKTMNIYAKLNEACEGLVNEKFIDVAGLHRPNFLVFMTYIKAHLGELESIKFAVEMRIEDRDKRDLKDIESKWKECIAKIPQKDEFTLEGIETWHVSHYEMVPDYGAIHSPLFKDEAMKLIASGFSLAFNCSNGTGSILVTEGGFTIELWQYMKKTVIYKNTLDDVIDWIIYFYEAEPKSFR